MSWRIDEVTIRQIELAFGTSAPGQIQPLTIISSHTSPCHKRLSTDDAAITRSEPKVDTSQPLEFDSHRGMIAGVGSVCTHTPKTGSAKARCLLAQARANHEWFSIRPALGQRR